MDRVYNLRSDMHFRVYQTRELEPCWATLLILISFTDPYLHGMFTPVSPWIFMSIRDEGSLSTRHEYARVPLDFRVNSRADSVHVATREYNVRQTIYECLKTMATHQ
jgi:hypothetical protein